MSKKEPEKTKELFLATMDKTFGNVSAACKAVGISRTMYYNWKKTDEKFKGEAESDRFEENYLDAIEAKLAKVALIDENPTVLIFLAKTKGKKRGYIEKQEIDHTSKGESLKQTIIVSTEENKKLLEEFDAAD